ncbi:MAG: hypothetical protein PHQ27_01545 [Victivallales bacterium]|nr:hypothetical protein [Victivallales bacterium]
MNYVPKHGWAAFVPVVMCLVILLALVTLALQSVYSQHRENVEELIQVRREADRLHPAASRDGIASPQRNHRR